MNVAAFKEGLRAEVDKLHAANRPAAQAGAQIIYERARLNAPVSDESHFFYIRGQKYGPYPPGNLRDSIYQVYSKENSFKDVSTYHISFNKTEAPYGFIVHNGTSKTPADPFISKAVVETRAEVRTAIKARYLEEVNK
ncbi:HK97-gp10 family putative phage morphogenesis protein [Acidovorax kalamii]|nr:HK97-gp10 family putative phage morphogenesis protein [Acidovorax kalamii]